MKTRSILTVAAILLAGAGIAVAQTISVPMVTAITPTVDLLQIIPNGNPVMGNQYATGRQVGQIGAGLYTTTASVATSTATTEQVLATYSLPANWLSYVGRRLEMKSSFSAGATGNNKTFKCYFGASVISSGVLTTNAKNGNCTLNVVKTGASTQIVWGTMIVDTTPITGYVNLSGADTDTAAIVIKMTGTDGSAAAADIVLNDMVVVAVN